MFFQCGIVDILSKNKTKRLKDPKVIEELQKRRIYQRSNMRERYDMKPSFREHMPDATLVLDLTLNAMEMKQEFSKSCKRFLNKAKKAELSFALATEKEWKDFWKIWYTMAYDKGFSTLVGDGVDEGIPRSPQDGDEDLGLADFTGCRVDDIYGLPGIVDKQLFTGPVFMAHDYIEAGGPLTVTLAEPAVLVAVWVLLLVLLPKQVEGNLSP